MTQPSSGRPFVLIVGAFVALVMLEHALPAKVEAACGHGSTSKTEREAGSVFEHLEILSIDLSSHRAIPEGPARRPCSGPSCSGRGSSEPNVPIPPSLETGIGGCAPSCSSTSRPPPALGGCRVERR